MRSASVSPVLLLLISFLHISCVDDYEGLGSNTTTYYSDGAYQDASDTYDAGSNAVEPTHPDDIPCDGRDRHLGFRVGAVGDFSGEDHLLSYLYYVGKFLLPRLLSDCQIEEFFRGQDLRFENEWSRTAEDISTVYISAVGDLMARKRLEEENSIHLYDDVQDELFDADIVFGNLETPAHPDRGSRPFPSYNLSAEATRVYLGIDRPHGFDVVSTANNHVLDQGEEGLLATLDHLDELGVMHVGSSCTPEERDHGFPIIEANGVKIAFLAYTFSTNGRPLPLGRDYEVNLVRMNTLEGPPDISLIEKHLETARDLGADVVAVSLHWGMEYEFYPPRRIIDLGHRIADAGADVIFGHHPHILNPMESYVPKNRDRGVPEVLIAYSLGNFIPDQSRTVYRTTIILHLELSRGSVDGEERVWISNVDYTPVWWYMKTISHDGDYRLINLNKALAQEADYPFLSRRQWRVLRSARHLIFERF